MRAGSFWEAADRTGPARTAATAPFLDGIGTEAPAPLSGGIEAPALLSGGVEASAPPSGGTSVYPDSDPFFADADAADPIHDADELTVQLAGVDPASTAGAAGGRTGSQDGTGTPVFVDESGRRSRRLRLLGVAVGVACAVYALVIVATLVSGNSSAPWLPLPGLGDDTPAGKVETSSVPSVSSSRPGSGSAAPDPGSSESSDSAAPVSATAGGATDAVGASASPGRAAASTLPEASSGTTPVNPTATATASAPAASESAVASPEASQPDSGGSDPSPSAGDDTGGTGETGGEANSAGSAD
ncbi:hypothetical protein OG440_03145 [Streptomyces sp. NBC_00637]|uniref:hypothetical protein n=1 Tax=Streptomyces sp. NBC_00637 TaxID=2903667 RepID=UPI00324FF1AB